MDDRAKNAIMAANAARVDTRYKNEPPPEGHNSRVPAAGTFLHDTQVLGGRDLRGQLLPLRGRNRHGNRTGQQRNAVGYPLSSLLVALLGILALPALLRLVGSLDSPGSFRLLESEPSFTDKGALDRPQASFTGVPVEALLTLGMDVSSSWLVAPSESVHDLDNMKLSSVKSGNIVFEDLRG